eukprot:632083-Pelagomonas_calceolata.AAC.1
MALTCNQTPLSCCQDLNKNHQTKDAIQFRISWVIEGFWGRLLDGLLTGGQDASLEGWLTTRRIRMSLVAPGCASS